MIAGFRSQARRLAGDLLSRTGALRRGGIWAIGMYAGPSPTDLTPLPANPVLTHEAVTDVPALFTADPFMLCVGETWYLFFEVMNARSGKGEIALATSADGLSWRYREMVLVEPFHVAYPYVFSWRGEHYLIPEARSAGVRLYRARSFPTGWVLEATLLDGEGFVDASICRWRDAWYLFAARAEDEPATALHLYVAEDPTGPWREHPASPLRRDDPRLSRPAGRLIPVDQGVLRFAQDGEPHYGSGVRAVLIDRLTPDKYSEHELSVSPVLEASGRGWNGSGMHHVDAHRRGDGSWLACVDGRSTTTLALRAPAVLSRA